MHDLSIALRSRGACSAFSSGLITVVAAVSLAALPGFSAASFVNVKYGSPWALIRANAKIEGLPTQISIGMFRICYASPGPSCLAFSWGLSISKFSFQGADRWVAVLPPINATKAWPLLSAVAFFMTFMSAFVHCLNNAPVFVICTGILTLSVNLAYLSFTAYLFFSLRTQIAKFTEYEPSPVLISTAMLGTSLALVLIVGFLTIFTKKRGDTLYVRHFDEDDGEGSTVKEGGKDAEKGPIHHSEDISNGLSRDSNHLNEPEFVEKVQKLEDWRDAIETDEEEDRNNEEAETVEMQLKFISDPLYDPFTPQEVEKRRRAEMIQCRAASNKDTTNKKARDPLAPDPHSEFHDTPQRKPEPVAHGVKNALKRFVHSK